MSIIFQYPMEYAYEQVDRDRLYVAVSHLPVWGEETLDKFVKSSVRLDCGSVDLHNESHHLRSLRWQFEETIILQLNISFGNDSSPKPNVSNSNETHYRVDTNNGSLTVRSLVSGHGGQYECLSLIEDSESYSVEAAYRLHVYG